MPTFTINETDEINTPSATYIFSSSGKDDGGGGRRVDIAVGYLYCFPLIRTLEVN